MTSFLIKFGRAVILVSIVWAILDLAYRLYLNPSNISDPMFITRFREFILIVGIWFAAILTEYGVKSLTEKGK
jgi:hypothetical protein